MRWGVREETGNNHGTSAMCMNELARCHAESVGPSFVCFLGDRYGFRFFPAKAPKEELEVLLEWIGNEMPEAMSTLTKWFLLDENKVDAVYILQPIDSIYPAYTDQSDWAKHKEAKNLWWKDFEVMQKALRQAALNNTSLPKERRDLYIISVTNEEVMRGIVWNENRNEQTLMFRRSLTGFDWRGYNSKTMDLQKEFNVNCLDNEKDRWMLTRYSDWNDDEQGTLDTDAYDRLQELKMNTVPGTGLPESNIHDFDVDLKLELGVRGEQGLQEYTTNHVHAFEVFYL